MVTQKSIICIKTPGPHGPGACFIKALSALRSPVGFVEYPVNQGSGQHILISGELDHMLHQDIIGFILGAAPYAVLGVVFGIGLIGEGAVSPLVVKYE